MSADFDSGVFAGGESAWHNLGVTLPNAGLDSQEALQYGGLGGWNLTKQPVYSGNPEDGFLEIPGKFAVTRETDRKVMGVVGSTYTIVQNEDGFAWMDFLLGGPGFHIDTAISLGGGTTVCLVAKAPKLIDLPDSPIQMYVVISNSHDGSGAVKLLVTPVRVVCRNTQRAALRRAQRTVSIRHTSGAAARLEAAQQTLGLTAAAAARIEAEARRMLDTPITNADFQAILDSLVPTPTAEGRSRTMALNTRESISTIYSTAPDQVDIKGTAWGVFQAITNYTDHHMGGSAEVQFKRSLDTDPRLLPYRAMALLS